MEPSATAEVVLEALGFDDEARSRLKVMIGGRTLKPSEPIGDAPELMIFLPLGGG